MHPSPRRRAFIAAAFRAKARAVSDGRPGNGSTPHRAVALFARAAGIDLPHWPCKGGSPAIEPD